MILTTENISSRSLRITTGKIECETGRNHSKKSNGTTHAGRLPLGTWLTWRRDTSKSKTWLTCKKEESQRYISQCLTKLEELILRNKIWMKIKTWWHRKSSYKEILWNKKGNNRIRALWALGEPLLFQF